MNFKNWTDFRTMSRKPKILDIVLIYVQKMDIYLHYVQKIEKTGHSCKL